MPDLAVRRVDLTARVVVAVVVAAVLAIGAAPESALAQRGCDDRKSGDELEDECGGEGEPPPVYEPHLRTALVLALEGGLGDAHHLGAVAMLRAGTGIAPEWTLSFEAEIGFVSVLFGDPRATRAGVTRVGIGVDWLVSGTYDRGLPVQIGVAAHGGFYGCSEAPRDAWAGCQAATVDVIVRTAIGIEYGINCTNSGQMLPVTIEAGLLGVPEASSWGALLRIGTGFFAL